jgi:hypothetical protein
VGRRAGLAAAALVALHPVHAAWSTSAYNVVVPLSLLALAAAAVDRCGAPLAPAHDAPHAPAARHAH